MVVSANSKVIIPMISSAGMRQCADLSLANWRLIVWLVIVPTLLRIKLSMPAKLPVRIFAGLRLPAVNMLLLAVRPSRCPIPTTL